MEMTKQVNSYKQGIKLQKLGVSLEANFYWCGQESEAVLLSSEILTAAESSLLRDFDYIQFPAYTVAELMEMLPFSIRLTEMLDYNLICVKTGNGYAVCYERIKKDGSGTEKFKDKVLYRKNQTHALADFMIWLIENKHINPEDLK